MPFMCEDFPFAGVPVAVSGVVKEQISIKVKQCVVKPSIETATFPFLLLKFSISSFPRISPNFT